MDFFSFLCGKYHIMDGSVASLSMGDEVKPYKIHVSESPVIIWLLFSSMGF